MLNEFGSTARGRAWLRLAEPLRVTRPDPRLPRARSLARNDRVGALGTEPGRVVATVDDGRPYRVEVVFPVWDDEARATAATLLGAGAGAEDEAVAELAAAGVPLVPDDPAVRASCDCGRTDRCRHALAVLIELARRVDEAPDLAATLRGAAPRRGTGDTTRIRIADLDPRRFWTVTTP